ncbi:photoreceptor ankyrin repeat protein [Apteryx mantelli]|uniref:Photoreceptor ankyrin repeat protein n=1 Tax=Apteryx mantelli TaxID=2696672 RepID=A0A8B7JZ68_9AVES
MTHECSGREQAADPAPSPDASELELHYEEEEDDESSEESESSDTSSIFSDDSVCPCYELSVRADGAEDLSLYQCCLRNDAKLVQGKLERGVSRQEATELDINGRNGLMVACYEGFADVVPLLRKCPYININHQDNEGNTALMMAAQAGHITIVNYLLNYYPALEVDKRDCRGLTALMKAAVQGQEHCVTALLLAGADLEAVDHITGKTAGDWARFAGRFEMTVQIRNLLQRPRAEQFSNRYLPEWPALAEWVAQALSPKSRGERLLEKIRSAFTFNFPRDPEEDGVMDHMVRMTTCLASPFVATACRTICPNNPPEVGKRRLSVLEILKEHTPEQDPESEASSCSGAGGSSCNGQAVPEIRLLSPYRPVAGLRSFLPWRLLWRNSIFPGDQIPKIKLTKASSPPACKEKKQRSKNKNLLEPPEWRYKELKEEKRAAEEAEGGKKKKKGKKKP